MPTSGACGRSSEPPECDSFPSSRLTREQVVDRIITINPTATAEFLARFSERSLRAYLAHLQSATQPRGPGARWERPGDSPAIVAREARG